MVEGEGDVVVVFPVSGVITVGSFPVLFYLAWGFGKGSADKEGLVGGGAEFVTG